MPRFMQTVVASAGAAAGTTAAAFVYNHVPAPAGAVTAAAVAGNLTALKTALLNGGSTEEKDGVSADKRSPEDQPPL
jgi:hypothetical protein